MSTAGADREHPRLAIYCHTVLPGSQTFVKNQAEALTRFDVTMFGAERDPALKPTVPTFVLSESRPPAVASARVAAFKATRRSATLRRAIADARPDLLVAHFAQDAWRIAPTAQALGVPLVVVCHGSDVLATDDHARKASVSTRQLVGHWPDLADQASLFVATSAFVGDALLARGVPESKVRVCHLGVPMPSVVPTGARAGLLYVGRLVANKGPDDAIRAHARAAAQVPGLRLDVVGDGPERAALEELAAELGTTALVTFHGAQPVAEVAELMSTRAVLVVPSRRTDNGTSEGFGMVALEAGARALPVVAYATGGLPEAVGRGAASGGVLVPTGDLDAFVAQVVRLVGDSSAAAELGRRGRARVEADFDLRTRAIDFEDALLGLLPGAPR